MGVSKNNGTPKSSILKGISIIFTIHFGGLKPPIFGLTPIYPTQKLIGLWHKVPNGEFMIEMWSSKWLDFGLWQSNNFIFKTLQGGPPTSYMWSYGAPISRVITPFTHLFKAIYRGYNFTYN